jgi:hypothetical protein
MVPSLLGRSMVNKGSEEDLIYIMWLPYLKGIKEAYRC